MPTQTPHLVLQRRTRDGSNRWKEILEFITGGYWIDNEHWLHGGPDSAAVVYHRPGMPIIREATTQPFIHPHLAVLHTNAGPHKTAWTSLFSFWNRTDITGEAHLQIDGVDAGFNRKGATILNAIPFNRRADCNAKVNRWSRNSRYVGAISFETQDRGAATLNTTPWSPAQVHAMVGVLTCLCIVYGMGCLEPVTWDDSGIGHHARFKEWSIYTGKTCPGYARQRQMQEIRQQVITNLVAFMEHCEWKCRQGGVA